jgi:hypothetical protein
MTSPANQSLQQATKEEKMTTVSSSFQTYESMMHDMREKVAEDMNLFTKYSMPDPAELYSDLEEAS